MSDDILDQKITESKDRLVQLELEHAEARNRRRTLGDALIAERKLLYRLIDEKAGRTPPTLPGFDEALATANATHDEHQRGPTDHSNGERPQAKKKAGK